MASKEESFLSNLKIQQFAVQFACRIPIRKELTSSEKKALENILRSLDPSVFQLFDEGQKGPACLLQVLRQVPIGATTATIPSFVFSNDSFSFLTPIKMMGTPVRGIGSVDASDMNTKMQDWVFKVQNAIPNSSCQRTGKIYEIVVGPFTKSDKAQLFKNLFSTNLDDVGELMLTYAKYHTVNTEIFNIQTSMRYLQGKLDDRFFVNLRVDINNRNLANSMEPRDIVRVWQFADSIIDSHLKNTLEI